MSIELHTVDNGNVQAINDGRLYGEFTGNVGGIVNGSVVTSAGGLALHVTSGWGIGYGRVFTITADDYTVQPASSGTQKGRLYVHIDISQPDNPIDIRSVAAASLPALVQENLSEGGAIYEIELAHYDVTALAVSNLVSNSKIIITPVPKSGGTFSGSIVADTTNAGEANIAAKSAAGSIYLFAQNNADGARGIVARNAGGATNSLIWVNKDNAVSYSGGTFNSGISAPNIVNVNLENSIKAVKCYKLTSGSNLEFTITPQSDATRVYCWVDLIDQGGTEQWARFAANISDGSLKPNPVKSSGISSITASGYKYTITFTNANFWGIAKITALGATSVV